MKDYGNKFELESDSGSEHSANLISGGELGIWALPLGAQSDKKKNVSLRRTDKPDARLPDVWVQPSGTWLDRKCGLTAVSNLLRLYGKEFSPEDIDLSCYRSWGPGLGAEKFAEDMCNLSGTKFANCTIEDGEDPQSVLRTHLDKCRPVAILYMNGVAEAHWVVVVKLDESKGKDEAMLIVQSWGEYYTVPFKEIKEQWRRGWGGPYPHVVGDEASAVIAAKD